MTGAQRALMLDALAIVARIPAHAEAASSAMRTPVPTHMARVVARVLPLALGTAGELPLTDAERRTLSLALREAVEVIQVADGDDGASRRGRLLQVRVNDAEYERVTSLAEGAGLTVSEYIRKRALADEVPVR